MGKGEECKNLYREEGQSDPEIGGHREKEKLRATKVRERQEPARWL